jgi:hypothetical protein
MQADRQKAFGKANAKGVMQASDRSVPRSQSIGLSVRLLVALYFLAALHYAANAMLFDGQSSKLWFVQCWIMIGAPFLTIYLHYNVPVERK